MSEPKLSRPIKSINVLHVLTQTELTGAEVHMRDLVIAQQKLRQNVFVVSSKLHIEIPMGWTQLPLATRSRFQRFKNILALRRMIKKKNIEIIHCHSRGAVRQAFWARIGLRCALVSTFHGYQHVSLSKKLFNIYGDRLIAVCAAVKEQVTEQFGIRPEVVKVVSNPLNLNQFPVVQGLSSRKRQITWVTRSTGPKGELVGQFIDSHLQNFLSQFPQISWTLIISDQKHFSESTKLILQKLVTQFKSQLTVIDRTPQVLDICGESLLVIGSGRVSLESLCLQTPSLSIGEAAYIGLVNLNNVDHALTSNFGDMSKNKKDSGFDSWTQFIADLSSHCSLLNQESSFLLSEIECEQLSKKIRALTDADFVAKEVHFNYLQALAKRNSPAWIPSLMYHKIPDQPLKTAHRIFVVKEDFARHLRFFARQKMHTLFYSELADYFYGQKDWQHFPKKPLLISFDDGYQDNLLNAQPLLQTHKIKANLFLLASAEITTNFWDTKNTNEPEAILLTASERQQLDKSVFEIGSHGSTHRDWTQTEPHEVQAEALSSKLSLEKEFKQSVHALAYPFGETSDSLEAIARECQYSFAVNTDKGALHWADRPFGLFRANVFPQDGLFAIWRKTRTFYRWDYARKRERT